MLPIGYKNCVFSMDIVRHSLTLGGQLYEQAHNCTFNEFTQVLCKKYCKVQTYEQIYMTLRTVKQNMNERVEEYYE